MNIRTDLAMELQQEYAPGHLEGVQVKEEQAGRLHISRISILNGEAVKRIGKPVGEYITITMPPLSADLVDAQEEIDAVAKEIGRMVKEEGLILVVGLGNQQITPDALGPKVVEGIIATRHFHEQIARDAGLAELRPVAALAPGVLGQTGMETEEVVSAVAKQIRPAGVIVVDALASRSLEHLGCTVQLADSGISPGSGVANARKEISPHSLGMPVVSIGVPTVVDAGTLARDLLEESGNRQAPGENGMLQKGALMMVTPREIDVIITRAAKLISLAINRALQPQLSTDDITYLLQ